jgi:F0F1-type ATP synthase membrane subunit b/b'
MENVDPLMGIILPYVNFAIFFVLAIYFFRNPAAEAARKRRAEFEKVMLEASRAKEAADQRLAELNGRLAKLDKEVSDIRQLTKDSAQEEAAKILSDAETLAEHIKHEARRIADAEVQKARASLRSEIVKSVRDAVTQRIQSELDEKAQLTLVKKQIGTLNNIRAEG